VNIRNWVKFYLSTLGIGAVVAVITGFAASWDKYKEYFFTLDWVNIFVNASWLFGVGLIFATLSQMGYFAYLTVHRFGLGIFRSLWNPIQWLLIAFTMFDLAYFRYQFFAKENESVLPYLLIPIFLFLLGLAIGYLKAQQTNKSTFVAGVFFIVVVTTLEWVPVLRTNDQGWLYLMLVPLLVCNTYQLLALPKYLERSKQEREQLKARKEASIAK